MKKITLVHFLLVAIIASPFAFGHDPDNGEAERLLAVVSAEHGTTELAIRNTTGHAVTTRAVATTATGVHLGTIELVVPPEGDHRVELPAYLHGATLVIEHAEGLEAWLRHNGGGATTEQAFLPVRDALAREVRGPAGSPLFLYNPSDTPAELRVRTLGEDGAVIADSSGPRLAAGEVTEANAEAGGASDRGATIHVTSDTPLAAFDAAGAAATFRHATITSSSFRLATTGHAACAGAYGYGTCGPFYGGQCHAGRDYGCSATGSPIRAFGYATASFARVMPTSCASACCAGRTDHGSGTQVEIEVLLTTGQKLFFGSYHLSSLAGGVAPTGVPNRPRRLAKGQLTGFIGASGQERLDYWAACKGSVSHLHLYASKSSRNPIPTVPGQTPGHPDHYGYVDPDSVLGVESVLIPLFSRTQSVPSTSSYDVYGLAGQPLYASLALRPSTSTTFVNVGVGGRDEANAVADVFIMPQATVTSSSAPLTGNRSFACTRSTGCDLLLFPYIERKQGDGTPIGSGYPVKVAILQPGSEVVDNDQRLQTNCSLAALPGYYVECGSGESFQGYLLGAKLFKGQSGAYARFFSSQSGPALIFVHVPTGIPNAATSVSYKIYPAGPGTTPIQSDAISHALTGDSTGTWIQLRAGAQAEFNLGSNAYVGLSVEGVPASQSVAVDAVKFVRTAPNGPRIAVSPTSLSRSVSQGSNAAPLTFTISNAGAGTLTWSATDNVTWATLSPTSGTLTTGTRTVTVSFSSAGLGVGTYSGTITVAAAAAANSPVSIPLVLTVTAAAPRIAVSPTSLSRSVSQGSNAAPLSFTISNAGAGTLTWSATDNVTWATLSPTSGTLTTGTRTVTVSFSSAGLGAGTYSGTITVAATGAANSPVSIPLVLTVTAAAPRIGVSPSALTRSVTQGANAASATFWIWNAGAGTLNWTATDNVAWASLSPTSGSLASGSTSVNVTFFSSSLGAGTHSGAITITAPSAENTPVVIPLTLTVTPGGPVVLLDEGFESSTGFHVVTVSGSPWRREASAYSRSGSYRMRLGTGVSGSASYLNNTIAYLVSPLLNLSGRSSATLTYWYKHQTERNYDYFSVDVSVDGGASWTTYRSRSGLSPGWDAWASDQISLPVGGANTRIRFRFTSDGSVNSYFGIVLDDVRVVAQ